MADGTNREAYDRRVNRVVSYICAHLDEPLTVELLSEVAGFSKFHFHRQYVARMPAVSEHEQVTDVYLPLR